MVSPEQVAVNSANTQDYRALNAVHFLQSSAALIEAKNTLQRRIRMAWAFAAMNLSVFATGVAMMETDTDLATDCLIGVATVAIVDTLLIEQRNNITSRVWLAKIGTRSYIDQLDTCVKDEAVLARCYKDTPAQWATDYTPDETNTQLPGSLETLYSLLGPEKLSSQLKNYLSGQPLGQQL